MKHLSLLIPIGLHAATPVCAQQWYDMHPSGNYYHRIYGGGFSLNGKAWFGFGEDELFGGDLDGSWFRFDPATNAITNTGVAWGIRSHVTAFAVGGYGYLGLGNIGDLWLPGSPSYVTNKIAVFDPVAEQFVSFIADFPGGPRLDAIAFSIGGKAYVGGGVDVDTTLGTAVPVNDLWEYDPITDSWTARANMPAALSSGRTFELNGKGYLLVETTSTLWEFDPIANSWAVRAPYPGLSTNGRVAFALNGVGYAGTGEVGSYTQEMHAYDPVANTWGPAPPLWYWTGRTMARAFTIGSDAYVFGGLASGATGLLADLWRFGAATTPTPNTWTQRPYLPATARTTPIAFTIGDKGYVGGGTGQFGNLTDFWMYDPVAMTWTARAALPANADEGFGIGDTGYVVTNGASGNFFAYDPGTNTWSPRADLPGGARTRSASFAMEGKGCIGGGFIGGVRTSTFYCYDPLTNSWTQRASIPGSPRHSSNGFAIGNKGYYVNGNMNGSSTTSGIMYRYDPVLDTWTQVGGYPFNTNGSQCAMAFSIGNKAYIGGGFVGGPTLSRRFYAYDPATNGWTQLTALGGGFRYDGVGFSIGEKGYIFGGQYKADTNSFSFSTERSNDLWEYNPSIIHVSPRAFLDGPFDALMGMMHDSLNVQGRLNELDPYGANGYPYPGGNYSDMPVEVPTTTGNDAVVDRLIVELRDAVNPAIVRATRHVWLQRDGDVVDMDGSTQVRFTLAPGDYHVSVRHRNHLATMTAAPVTLGGTTTSVDFTSPGTATYGTDARRNVGGVATLWAGDATFDSKVKYVGLNNDRDAVLLAIGGVVPTNTVSDYLATDVNMDGTVKYVGTGNDRDRIFLTIGGLVPTIVRSSQMP